MTSTNTRNPYENRDWGVIDVVFGTDRRRVHRRPRGRHARVNSVTKIKELHILINSRLTELIAASVNAAHATGLAEGTKVGRREPHRETELVLDEAGEEARVILEEAAEQGRDPRESG